MSKEAMKLALEWIEAQPEPRMLGAFGVIKALRDRLYRPIPTLLAVCWVGFFMYLSFGGSV